MTAGLPFRPFPLVLAAPSGTGKTTIAHRLVERFDTFVSSVSATTREPRKGERQGEDYDFVSREAFREMIRRGELVEWAEVHGNLYGTPRRNLEAASEGRRVPVLDIDVQGARQIRERVAEAVLVFVFPPSAGALWSRLTGRGSEDREEVRRRLGAARGELEEAARFDYVVVNDHLERAVARVHGIVEAECHRPGRVRDFPGEAARIRAEIDELLERQGAPDPTRG